MAYYFFCKSNHLSFVPSAQLKELVDGCRPGQLARCRGSWHGAGAAGTVPGQLAVCRGSWHGTGAAGTVPGQLARCRCSWHGAGAAGTVPGQLARHISWGCLPSFRYQISLTKFSPPRLSSFLTSLGWKLWLEVKFSGENP